MSDSPVKPKRRKDLAFMVCLIVVLALFVLSCLAFSIAVGQSVERGSRNRDRAQIAALQSALAVQTETTTCVRLFAVARDEARDKRDTAVGVRDTALADTIIVAVSRGDIAPEIAKYTMANVAATAANAAAMAASSAYSEYLTDPVLPCPIIS